MNYVRSIGRYSKTGYLWNEYGMGCELSQAFCRQVVLFTHSRYSAVHGSTFILRCDIVSVDRTNQGFKIVLQESDTQHTFYAKYLIATPKYSHLTFPLASQQPVVSK
jgi:RAB protein geranylgeranyltransferase component A